MTIEGDEIPQMVRDEEKWPQWITWYKFFERAAFIIALLLFGLTFLWGGDAGYGDHDETGYFLAVMA